jgi:hypothetical protein
MHLRGIVRTATLVEGPAGGDVVDMVLKVQGVGAGQPRTIVVPYDLLLLDEGLDPEAVAGHGFEADAEADDAGRWVVSAITVAGRRVLREPEGG